MPFSVELNSSLFCCAQAHPPCTNWLTRFTRLHGFIDGISHFTPLCDFEIKWCHRLFCHTLGNRIPIYGLPQANPFSMQCWKPIMSLYSVRNLKVPKLIWHFQRLLKASCQKFWLSSIKSYQLFPALGENAFHKRSFERPLLECF